jgi:hypothetical protein
MMTAAAVGNSGVRLYQFEPPGVQNQRAKQALGTELQTGASPLAAEATSQDLWKALGYAANLLTKTLQPFILGTVAPSPALGSNIVTAVRQSASGTMVLAINATDWDRSLVVDLTPYRAGNAITRYTVGYKGITSVVIPDTASDSLILKKGQAGIWLFPVASTMSYLSSNPIPTPSLPGGAAAAILHYAYIYSQDLDSQTDGADCTSGCSLALDRGLGDVFYQFFFVDNNGTLVAKSSVNLIPGN